jgi:protein-L-isoaspartate(D-aspartate) O-methyltransferase
MNLLVEDALIAQELRLSGDEVALEVGTATGYLTVLLADLCRFIVTVDRIPSFADTARYHCEARKNIEYRVGDGTLGCAEHVPFDRVIVSGAVSEPPPMLVDQLRPGGLMLLPLEWRRASPHTV